MARRLFYVRFRSLLVASALIVGCNHCGQRSCCNCCSQGSGCCAGPPVDSASEKPPQKLTAQRMPSANDKDAQSDMGKSTYASMEKADRLPPLTDPRTVSHATDYSWIAGELKHYDISNVWRLRYSPAGERDRYNGSVTLMGAGSLAKFKDGELVRVTGHLADAESSAPNPVYVVDSIQPVAGSR
jgi:hypothetical protein